MLDDMADVFRLAVDETGGIVSRGEDKPVGRYGRLQKSLVVLELYT